MMSMCQLRRARDRLRAGLDRFLAPRKGKAKPKAKAKPKRKASKPKARRKAGAKRKAVKRAARAPARARFRGSPKLDVSRGRFKDLGVAHWGRWSRIEPGRFSRTGSDAEGHTELTLFAEREPSGTWEWTVSPEYDVSRTKTGRADSEAAAKANAEAAAIT